MNRDGRGRISEISAAGSSPLRVLLVEDNPSIQDAICRILTAEHDIVGVIERGDEVVATAEHLIPDIVVLDISLPGRSGMHVLPELRAALPDIGIVMLTTLVDPLYRETARARGADDFVAKGRAITDLLPAIRAAQAAQRVGQRRQA